MQLVLRQRLLHAAIEVAQIVSFPTLAGAYDSEILLNYSVFRMTFMHNKVPDDSV